MAYEKQKWQDYETPITAERLNHIENGIEEAFEHGSSDYDSLPAGSIINFEGTEVPEGYEEVENDSEIIWTNSNPEISFGAQTITLNKSLENYDCYEILFRQNTTTKRIFTTGRIPATFGTILNYCASTLRYRPTSETITNTTISFENAMNGSNQDNRECIPVYIIGHKTVFVLGG